MKKKSTTISMDHVIELKSQLSSGTTAQFDVSIYDKLCNTMKAIVTKGESNSILIVGPPGSGKSTLVQAILSDLSESPETEDSFQIVRLNGILQTNDRLALKEIAKQLKMEDIERHSFTSFAENLQFVLDSLKRSDRNKSQPVLFILDHFELFCNHHRQTLLYNLFDVAQSNQAPVGVIGLTFRLDAVELLEKRVKSRFSNRLMMLNSPETIEDYRDTAVRMLSLPDDSKHSEEWGFCIDYIFEKSIVDEVLRWQFEIDNSYAALKSMLFTIVCHLSEERPFLSTNDFVVYREMKSADPKVQALLSLSTLEITLIIAMKHLHKNYDGAPFNFEMILNEFEKFATRRSTMQHVSPTILFKTVQTLKERHLITSMNKSIKHVTSLPEYVLYQLAVSPHQLKAALTKYNHLPTDVKQWAESSYA